jgi:hypothetical protein
MPIEQSSKHPPSSRLVAVAHRLLDASKLCAIATVSPGGRAHINTAYFASGENFEIVWLSAPDARHSRNVREGHLATVGQLDQLVGMRAHRVEIEFADRPPVDRLRGIPGFEQVAVEDHRVSGMFRGDFEPLLAALASLRVTKFESREPSLEEIFLSFYR